MQIAHAALLLSWGLIFLMRFHLVLKGPQVSFNFQIRDSRFVWFLLAIFRNKFMWFLKPSLNDVLLHRIYVRSILSYDTVHRYTTFLNRHFLLTRFWGGLWQFQEGCYNVSCDVVSIIYVWCASLYHLLL